MRFSIAVLVLTASSARAEHSHAVDGGSASTFGASVTMLAASYDTTLYAGNYEGVVPGLHWSNKRFAAGTNLALYRLEKNGAASYGIGDLVVHGQAALITNEHLRAGVVAAVSAPVGDEQRGMGMGHPMVMPALFAQWSMDRTGAAATAGYSRAIGGDADHDHGMWPLVEPMNFSELTWSIAGDYAITPTVRTGARASGGVPIGDGDQRVVGTVRVAWGSGRLSTAGELQVGLVGDPFTLRGVVTTALTF